MGDADQLMFTGKRPHFRADRVRDFAADIGIDLVEHEQGNRIVRGECGFDCA